MPSTPKNLLKTPGSIQLHIYRVHLAVLIRPLDPDSGYFTGRRCPQCPDKIPGAADAGTVDVADNVTCFYPNLGEDGIFGNFSQLNSHHSRWVHIVRRPEFFSGDLF